MTIAVDNGRAVFPQVYTHVQDVRILYLLFFLAIIATYDLPLYSLTDGRLSRCSPRRGPIHCNNLWSRSPGRTHLVNENRHSDRYFPEKNRAHNTAIMIIQRI